MKNRIVRFEIGCDDLAKTRARIVAAGALRFFAESRLTAAVGSAARGSAGCSAARPCSVWLAGGASAVTSAAAGMISNAHRSSTNANTSAISESDLSVWSPI